MHSLSASRVCHRMRTKRRSDQGGKNELELYGCIANIIHQTYAYVPVHYSLLENICTQPQQRQKAAKRARALIPKLPSSSLTCTRVYLRTHFFHNPCARVCLRSKSKSDTHTQTHTQSRTLDRRAWFAHKIHLALACVQDRFFPFCLHFII